MSPRVRGIRERIQQDYSWCLDLEPGRPMYLALGDPAIAAPRLSTVEQLDSFDNTVVILDVRASSDTIRVTIVTYRCAISSFASSRERT
jgi:hypothetical protein